mmetsp:Transcript_15693/g.47090  ORF Transcript_15693/g.47090 Transcript_15693/m.47090 type:complete len:284 (-) Transcript_15693:1956-2807(-)
MWHAPAARAAGLRGRVSASEVGVVREVGVVCAAVDQVLLVEVPRPAAIDRPIDRPLAVSLAPVRTDLPVCSAPLMVPVRRARRSPPFVCGPRKSSRVQPGELHVSARVLRTCRHEPDRCADGVRRDLLGDLPDRGARGEGRANHQLATQTVHASAAPRPGRQREHLLGRRHAAAARAAGLVGGVVVLRVLRERPELASPLAVAARFRVSLIAPLLAVTAARRAPLPLGVGVAVVPFAVSPRRGTDGDVTTDAVEPKRRHVVAVGVLFHDVAQIGELILVLEAV